MTLDAITKFAKKQGYRSVKELKPWNGYKVYEPVFDDDSIAFIGLPLVILVKGQKIRLSTPDEALKMIDEMEE